MDVSNRTLPSRNLGTNPKELHTLKSTPKKLEGDNGDMKKKLKLDKVLYENEARQKVDIMFWELSKQKLLFVGKIIKALGI
jgi:hypothetical protein